MDKVLDSALLSSANKRKGILAIGAHPDDIELGCGASLARLAQKGIYSRGDDYRQLWHRWNNRSP